MGSGSRMDNHIDSLQRICPIGFAIQPWYQYSPRMPLCRIKGAESRAHFYTAPFSSGQNSFTHKSASTRQKNRHQLTAILILNTYEEL